jgi:hypothetical protein
MSARNTLVAKGARRLERYVHAATLCPYCHFRVRAFDWPLCAACGRRFLNGLLFIGGSGERV